MCLIRKDFSMLTSQTGLPPIQPTSLKGWFQVKSSKSENPQKMEFALFWCKGTPWGVIQES